jgi:hypothetical protein
VNKKRIQINILEANIIDRWQGEDRTWRKASATQILKSDELSMRKWEGIVAFPSRNLIIMFVNIDST